MRSASRWSGVWWSGTLLFIRSRFMVTALAVTAAAVLLVRAFIGFVPEISLNASRPIRFLPLLELVPVVVVVVWVLATGPRLGEWETLAGRRYRWHTLAATVSCLAVPQLVVLLSASALPPRDPWTWMAANVLAVSAVAVLLSALVGHLLATVTTIALYGLAVVTQNIAGPVIDWLPITSGWDPRPRWVAAMVLTVVALVVYRLRGATELIEARRQRNED